MKCAGLIIDDSPHYLDHLAPLCALLNYPLIICEESIAAQCKHFYPQVHLIQLDFKNLRLPLCIISCDNRDMFFALLGPFCSWKGYFIWLPHGMSDKGWKSPFFEALGKEDLLLVYGQRMRDTLRKKKINIPIALTGNFRRHFYLRHSLFYERLLEERFGNQRFILYAPTWEDSEQNGTFWVAFPKFLNNVPKPFHLIIKIHPNTEKCFSPKVERCRGLVDLQPNITFLDEFPTIYPLLSRIDAYIGDMSSIGYDFLTFHKPLFFLRKQVINPNRDESAFLMGAGEQILIDEIPKLFKKPFFSIKTEERILQLSFDPIPWEKASLKIQKQIDVWCETIGA